MGGNQLGEGRVGEWGGFWAKGSDPEIRQQNEIYLFRRMILKSGRIDFRRQGLG